MSGPFVYHYARYFVEYRDEYDTLEEALDRSWYDHEYGDAYGIAILQCERVVYDHAALFAYWCQRGAAEIAAERAASHIEPAPPGKQGQ